MLNYNFVSFLILAWTIPGRNASAIDEFWKEVPPPPHSTLSYPAMSENMSHYQSHLSGKLHIAVKIE
jgi:hypothetical protein